MKIILATLCICSFIAGIGISRYETVKHGGVMQDSAVDYLTTKWITKTTPMGLPNEKWAHDLVRKNIMRDLDQWRRAANDPRRVVISHALDTGNYTVSLLGTCDSKVTLWLDKVGNVESISAY